MKWAPQQRDALDAVAAWHRESEADMTAGRPLRRPVFRTFGYAGTGKTTLARHFAGQIDGETVYAAFTGKAAMVMKKNGCANARTIHSLIYDVDQDDATGGVRFRWKADSDASDAALIVIDECSMVDADLGNDLLRFNRPVLVLGDPAQLPPVKARNDNGRGAGFFTEADPDVMLTDIHRQARDNPIIQIATDIREGRAIELGQYGKSRIITYDEITSEAVVRADQVLVGRRDTRAKYNRRIRHLLGRAAPGPEVGDRLVCLKNSKTHGIFNGGMFEIIDLPERNARQRAESRMPLVARNLDQPDRQPVEAEARVECFLGGIDDVPWQEKRGTAEFDYGYALTVHKAQGSQWDTVVLFDESGVFRDDWRRWLYTGVTRAAERVEIVTNRGGST